MTREADFPMIETKPIWPTVLVASLIGAIVVVAIVALLRGGDEAPTTEHINTASAKTAVEEVKAELKPVVQAVTDPNLIKSSLPLDQSMVPTKVADRFKERAEGAEKKLKDQQKKIAGLEHQVAMLENQIAAIHRAQQPPPPTEAEEVLDMLRPALTAKVE